MAKHINLKQEPRKKLNKNESDEAVIQITTPILGAQRDKKSISLYPSHSLPAEVDGESAGRAVR